MDRYLVLNTGSSSVKWALLDEGGKTLGEGNQRWKGRAGEGHGEEIAGVLSRAGKFEAVGHRVVHGGDLFREARVVDAKVREGLAGLVELDPLHMRPAVAGIDAVANAFPKVPQVVAFDTAFHATMPEAARGYGLPFEWEDRYGARRYGFHGLAVDWDVSRAAEMLGSMSKLPRRMIVAHLGSGCSVTACLEGRSVDTSMGYSPLEGLIMGTRAGSVDPGLLLQLETRHGLSADSLLETLADRSGLLGLSGVSNDLREVMAAMDADNSRAKLAYDRFVLSVRRAVGAAAGVLGGADALVFSGGIGENAPRVRSEVVAAVTGITLDEPANQQAKDDAEISTRDSACRALVIKAREERIVLREMRRLLA